MNCYLTIRRTIIYTGLRQINISDYHLVNCFLESIEVFTSYRIYEHIYGKSDTM